MVARDDDATPPMFNAVASVADRPAGPAICVGALPETNARTVAWVSDRPARVSDFTPRVASAVSWFGDNVSGGSVGALLFDGVGLFG